MNMKNVGDRVRFLGNFLVR